jgi:thiamine pyrophosphate-dependent acetolactate synthase large subunit-like protein
VLVLATDIPSQPRRPGTYRVLHEGRDQAGMFAPVVKRTMTAADPQSVPADVLAAAELALTPPTGPVYLGIPTDFLPVRVPSAKGFRSDVQPRLPDEPRIEAAVHLLEAAQAPLICAGGGALRAEAGPAVAALAERLGAPVVMTTRPRDCSHENTHALSPRRFTLRRWARCGTTPTWLSRSAPTSTA